MFSIDAYEGGIDVASDAILEIGKQTSEFFRVFTSTGQGSKMINYLKEYIGRLSRKEASMKRIAALLSSSDQTPTADVLARADAELSQHGFPETVARDDKTGRPSRKFGINAGQRLVPYGFAFCR